jgi:hypothetical protein
VNNSLAAESNSELRSGRKNRISVHMNTNRAATNLSTHPHAPGLSVVQDYEQFQQAQEMIEHLTIPGFLRRIPRQWHLEEIHRFGDKVSRSAESMCLAYITTVDSQLGVIRVFPAKMLERIYTIMAPQFGWPVIIDAQLGLEDSRKIAAETLKSREKLARHNRALLNICEDEEMQHALAVVIAGLDRDCERLRSELGIEAPGAAAATAA